MTCNVYKVEIKRHKDCTDIIYIVANSFDEVMCSIKSGINNIQSITKVLDNVLVDIDTLKLFKSL